MGPGRGIPVLRLCNDDGDRASAEPFVSLEPMAWGLVPSFTKLAEGARPDHFRLMNARSETAASLASFRRLVHRRRCAVLMDGWYEWKLDEQKQKQPWYCYLRSAEPDSAGAADENDDCGSSQSGASRPLYFAALWDTHESQDGSVLQTVTILTTGASAKLEWLHHRMPCILNNQRHEPGADGGKQKSALECWLDLSVPAEEALSMLTAYEQDDLQWHPVSKQMNSLSFAGENCTAPIKLVKPKSILSFWGSSSSSSSKSGDSCPVEKAACAPANEKASAAAAAATTTRRTRTPVDAPSPPPMGATQPHHLPPPQPPTPPPSSGPVCAMCTFINVPGASICSMCENPLLATSSQQPATACSPAVTNKRPRESPRSSGGKSQKSICSFFSRSAQKLNSRKR